MVSRTSLATATISASSNLRRRVPCSWSRRLREVAANLYDFVHMVDPSQRLVPSTAPEDHPIHGAAESGDLARVCAFLDQEPSLVHDVNRAGGHPLHRAVIGGSAKVVTLLLDRGADIHAIHGAGVGSLAGYAPQDMQPIDLAIWGGPRQVPVSKWRSLVGVLKWHLWKRWWPAGQCRRATCPWLACSSHAARPTI